MKLGSVYEDQRQMFLIINNMVITINAAGKAKGLWTMAYVTNNFFFFFWSSSICEGEWVKLCDIGEYLDYKNCK